MTHTRAGRLRWARRCGLYGSCLCLSPRCECARHPHPNRKLARHPPILGRPLSPLPPHPPQLEGGHWNVRSSSGRAIVANAARKKSPNIQTSEASLRSCFTYEIGEALHDKRCSSGSGPTFAQAFRTRARDGGCGLPCTLLTHSLDKPQNLSVLNLLIADPSRVCPSGPGTDSSPIYSLRGQGWHCRRKFERNLIGNVSIIICR